MKKNLLIGVAVAVFVIGTGAMVLSDSIRFRDVINSLSNLNPRVLSLVALPFVIILVVIGHYLLKKNEERKWKNALLKTRAAREKQRE